MPIDTSAVLQGLLSSYRPQPKYTFGAFGDDGSQGDQGGIIPSQGQLDTPFEREQTQRAAQADVADQQRIQQIRKLQQQASLQGYSDPQEMAGAQRHAETQKLQMPLEVERERSRGALAVAGEKGSQEAAIQKAKSDAQAQALQQFLSGGAAGRPGGSISIPGVGSMTTPRDQPAVAANTLGQIASARRAYEQTQGGLRGLFGMQAGGPQKLQLDQLISGAVANHPADQALKMYAQQVSKDPRTQKLPLDQILEMTGESDLNPVEKSHIAELLSIIRGF